MADEYALKRFPYQCITKWSQNDIRTSSGATKQPPQNLWKPGF